MKLPIQKSPTTLFATYAEVPQLSLGGKEHSASKL